VELVGKLVVELGLELAVEMGHVLVQLLVME